jgi:hypothetical protein
MRSQRVYAAPSSEVAGTRGMKDVVGECDAPVGHVLARQDPVAACSDPGLSSSARRWSNSPPAAMRHPSLDFEIL